MASFTNSLPLSMSTPRISKGISATNSIDGLHDERSLANEERHGFPSNRSPRR
jgi:hypothetical protein